MKAKRYLYLAPVILLLYFLITKTDAQEKEGKDSDTGHSLQETADWFRFKYAEYGSITYSSAYQSGSYSSDYGSSTRVITDVSINNCVLTYTVSSKKSTGKGPYQYMVPLADIDPRSIRVTTFTDLYLHLSTSPTLWTIRYGTSAGKKSIKVVDTGGKTVEHQDKMDMYFTDQKIAQKMADSFQHLVKFCRSKPN